jgi:PhnB protein
MTDVSPIPDDRPQLSVYLTVRDGARAIDFYRDAFGAEELSRLADASGRIGHADLRIGAAYIMLADEFPEYGNKSPLTLGGSPAMIHIYVEDPDAVVDRAVGAGAQLLEPVRDQFYGDRGGRIADPFGHIWWIASRIEVVPDDEMRRRAHKLYGLS